MSAQMKVPHIAELTEFFGAEPVEQSIDDGYWCYEVADQRGIALRFSLNIYEHSVQTTLSLSGERLTTVSHEFADNIRFREGALYCEFSTRSSSTSLTVDLRKGVSVVWATLRVE
jgi:hypothetical protein